MKRILLPLVFISMTATAQSPAAFKGTYPTTRTDAQVDTFFGTAVADPYRWLEDDRSEETHSWVMAQNAVTDGYLKQIPFREAIKKRLTELWNYEKYSVPFHEGGYTYYYKNDGLQNQSILYRQNGKATAEVFLDPNKFSKDGTSSLAGIFFTKDGSLCTYLISEGGSDWNKAFIMNTKTKKQVGETMTDLKFSGIAWKGNDGFFYSTYDKPKGSILTAQTSHHKLMYHKLGTPQSEDGLIFGGEETPRRYIGGSVTEDQNFLVITAANATYGNELYIQNLTMERAPITPIVTGFENEQDVVWSKNGKLFIITNRDAPNKRLVAVDAANPAPKNWVDVIPESEFPLSISTCGGKFYAHYLKDAVSKVYQYNTSGKMEREIALPGLGTASGFSGKQEEHDLYYSFTSYIYPPTIFHFDIASGKTNVYKKPAVKFNPAEFESKQVFYNSLDGTKVPMIITFKKGMKLDGTNPTMLYGYGGFSISITPSFSVSNLSFMEAGGVYAVANIRGGGEYGDKWHDAGIKLHKQNVFDDFFAAAQYLVNNKYTDTKRLAISGASNGGLLIGATITQHPEYFKVAFPQVGVLDMLRYNKFTAGAGWAYDYGTAEDSKEMFEYLLKYSPDHNVRKGTCYPATLVMTGDHDDRVVPAHSFKFASELQAAQNCENPVLIRIETKAGHGAGKPTSMLIDEQADKCTF
ncbi:MAG: prolyl oligopeptidase family serine peptidase, partial [Chitinophagaceae bacterium]